MKDNTALRRYRSSFEVLEAAAIEGRRCPANGAEGLVDKAASALARAGHIRIEVAGKNWRIVHILTGPHAGKHTALPPDGGRVWMWIDTDGIHTDTAVDRRETRGAGIRAKYDRRSMVERRA